MGRREGDLPDSTAKDMADAILRELEAGTERGELRRMLIEATGESKPGTQRPGRQDQRPPASRAESKTDLKALQKTARMTGDMIHRGMEGYPRRVADLEDTLRIPFSHEATMIAALVIMNAAARSPRSRARTRDGLLRRWEYSISRGSRERFIPVLPMAVRLLRNIRGEESERAVRIIAETAGGLANPAAVGELMQRLAPEERKKLAAYHTRDTSAALMAQLAVPAHRDWSGQQALHYRIADYSCGTGTLLCAAVRRVRELTKEAGEYPAWMHGQMMEQCITAIDILPASVAVAVTELDALEENPRNYPKSTGGITLRHGPIGGTRGKRGRISTKRGRETPPRAVGLGALDLFQSNFIKRQTLRPITKEGWEEETGPVIQARSQNLVIMNPPFTKETKSPLAPVGNEEPTTPEEREMIRQRMKDIRSITHGGGQNGLAYHFAMLAHRMVATGGTIALLLPETALTGSGNAGRGWPKFRRTLINEYQGIVVVGITAFEEEDSAFRHDTKITEVILLARKQRKGDYHRRTADFVTINRRPRNTEEAARTGDIIQDLLWSLGDAASGETRETQMDDMKIRAIKARLSPDGGPWRETRVNNQQLNEWIRELGQQRTLDPSGGIPMTTLGEIAKIGPDGATLGGHGYRRSRENPSRQTEGEEEQGQEAGALIAHECELQRSMETDPNGLVRIQPGSLLRLSRLHINNNFRYNSQSTAACMTREPTVGSKFWPTIGLENETAQKVLAIWMNTTPGLVGHWYSSIRTQHGMGYLSSRNMKDMMVLDPNALSKGQLAAIEALFQEAKDVPMLPANEAWRDGARIELDRRMMEILGMAESAARNLARMRELWCYEPTVVGRKGRVVHRQPEMERLREMVMAA